MAEFERGFKADCEKLSVEIREELGAARWDPLDMDEVARHLDVPIITLAATGAADDVVAWACSDEGAVCFSAFTVMDSNGSRVIVLNDSHPPVRRASNIAHELAHALLLHELAPVYGGDGNRSYDSQIEREAEFLAGALLVSRPMARGVVVRGESLEAASSRLGVSEQMLRYRIQVTGANRPRAKSPV